MKPLRIAVIGFGRVGAACSQAILGSPDFALVGIVRRPETAQARLAGPFRNVPVATHVSELAGIGVALVCVPTQQVREAAGHLLEHRVPIVECATLHGEAFREHVAHINRIALHHRTPAIVGAGWDPGALSVFCGLFALLTPKGHTEIQYRPGLNLHHTLSARNVRGVRNAVCADLPGPDGKLQRYVYVELEPGTDPDQVTDSVCADPLFLDRETFVVPVESVAALEQEGHGVVLERRGSAATAARQRFLLEARFDATALTAQVMLAAARAVPNQRPGAHSLFQLPLAALGGGLAL